MRVNGRVHRKFSIAGSSDRVVLFSWAAETDPRECNIARVDLRGHVVWRAELPGKASNDCFVSLAPDGDGFVARTYSEWVVRLDADGRMRAAVREPLSV